MENVNKKPYNVGQSCTEKHIALFCLDDLTKNILKIQKMDLDAFVLNVENLQK